MKDKKTSNGKDKTAFMSKCLISVLLVIALFVMAMPQTLNALGETIEREKNQEAKTEEVLEENTEKELYESDFSLPAMENTKPERYIKFEDTTKRGAYEKHFMLSDGMFVSETYIEPVHYEESPGVWKDIDNRLIEFNEDNGTKLKNAENSFKVEFAAEIEIDNALMNVEKDGYSLEFFLVEYVPEIAIDEILSEQVATTLGKTDKNDARRVAIISDEDMYSLQSELNYDNVNLTESIKNKNLDSKIKYNSVLTDTDLEYIIEPNRVKENIIINKPQDKYIYSFKIETQNLRLDLCIDEILAINHHGEVIFAIPAPYMFDADGDFSYAVCYELAELKSESEYLLTITPDDGWINSENRAFPVTVDPTIMTYASDGTSRFSLKYYNGNSLTPISNTAEININSSNWLIIDYTKSLSNVANYQLQAYVRPSTSYPTYNDFTFYLAKPSPFTLSNPVFSELSTERTSMSDMKHVFFSPDVFSLSANGQTATFGLGWNSTTTLNISYISVCEYYSVGDPISEAAETFDNEDFLLNIDVLNNKPVINVPLHSVAAPAMPLSARLIYKPGLSTARKSIFSNAQDFYGVDWKLNIEQFLLRKVSSSNTYYCDYMDASGTIHMLFYRDSDGLYTGTTTDLAYNPATRFLGTPLNPSMYQFDTYGRLIRIQNEDGQYITVEYSGNYNQISQITNYYKKTSAATYSAGQRIIFGYNGTKLVSVSSGKVSPSTSIIQKRITYVLGSNNIEEIQADNSQKIVKFGYSGSNISTIHNRRNTGFSITKNSSTLTTVQRIGIDVNNESKLFNKAEISTSTIGDVKTITAKYYQSTTHMYSNIYQFKELDSVMPVLVNYSKETNKTLGNKKPTEEIIYNTKVYTPIWSSMKTGEENQSISVFYEGKQEYYANIPVSNGSFRSLTISTNHVRNTYKNNALIIKASAKYNMTIMYGSSVYSYDIDTRYMVFPLKSLHLDYTVFLDFSGSGTLEYAGLGEIVSQTTSSREYGSPYRYNRTETPEGFKTVQTDENGKVNYVAVNYGEMLITDYIYDTVRPYLVNSETTTGDGKIITTTYTYEYSELGITYPRGLITKSETISKFDNGTGQIRQMEKYVHNAEGGLQKHTDINGDVNDYTYEYLTGGDYLLKTEKANNVLISTYYYHPDGRLNYVTDAAGQTANLYESNNGQNGVSYGSDYYYFKTTASGKPDAIQKAVSTSGTRTNMIDYNYDAKDRLSDIVYANGKNVRCTYDAYGNPEYVKYGDSLTQQYKYIYDNKNVLSQVEFGAYNRTYSDPVRIYGTPSVTKYTESVAPLTSWGRSAYNYSITDTYSGETGRLTSQNYVINGVSRQLTYDYRRTSSSSDPGAGNLLYKATDDIYSTNYTYSADGTVNSVTKKMGSRTYQNSNIVYDSYMLSGTNYVKDRVKGIDGYSLNYYGVTDNKTPNLKNITKDNVIIEYEYDSAERLTKEKNPGMGITYEYTYRAGTNDIDTIVEKNYSTNATLRTIVYNYNSNGRLIGTTGGVSNASIPTYDALGNPTKYGNKTLNWTQGTKLSGYNYSTSLFLTTWVDYSYDEQGRRYQKSINTAANEFSQGEFNNTLFYYDADRIIGEYHYTYSGSRINLVGTPPPTITSSHSIYYYYDDSGVVGMKYDGANYYFTKNPLGDIVGIYASDGWLVASYAYDAWGNFSVTKHSEITTSESAAADINPFRYRGYYWDSETGFYFLFNRYYDPLTRRFISADNYGLVPLYAAVGNNINLYAYCFNNPIAYIDDLGLFPKIIKIIYDTWIKYKEWSYTIHHPHVPHDQDHVHIKYKNKEVGNQNKDGTPHHKNKNKKDPTNKLKNDMKEHGWDWDGNLSPEPEPVPEPDPVPPEPEPGKPASEPSGGADWSVNIGDGKVSATEGIIIGVAVVGGIAIFVSGFFTGGSSWALFVVFA